MKITISSVVVATALLAACNTIGKVQQTLVADTPVAAIENTIAKPQVVELDLTRLFPSDFSGRKVVVNGALDLTTDSEGRITFDMPETDTILISSVPCPDKSSECEVTIPVSGWFVPYRYTVNRDGSVERKSPWVEFRMTPKPTTNLPQFDFLCRSEYPATVSINGIELKQYKTGIFFTTVKFNEGVNRVRATVVTPDSLTTTHEMEFIYEKRDLSRKAVAVVD